MGLLSTLFRAATPENQTFNLNDPLAWEAFLTGDPASSGVTVTRETALTYSPWWRGVNVISSDVGKLPLFLFRSTEGGKEKDKAHPAYYLLRRKPNSLMTAFQFRKLLTAHALQTGNGYAYISRDGAGRPLELIPMDPDLTIPVREDGTVLYVLEVEGQKRKLRTEDVFHLKGFGFDGLTGYSVYDKAREDLGLGMGARKYGAVFFKNNARPNVALEIPGRYNETDDKAIRASWERIHSGLDNSHKIALLWGGSKLTPFSINARESQLLETRQFSIRDIANWFGLPPHKLGDDTRTSYGSLEQENQDYLDSGLDPWLVAWEEESWDKLLAEEEKRSDSHYAEFDRKEILRANLAARGTYYRTATGGRPWMTPDEVREEESLNPVGGDFGELKDPVNISNPNPPLDKPPRGPADDGSARLEEKAGEITAMIGRKAIKAAGRPSSFMAFVDNLEASWGDDAARFFDQEAYRAGKEPQNCGFCLVTKIKEILLDVAGKCKPAELVAGVRAAMQHLDLEGIFDEI